MKTKKHCLILFVILFTGFLFISQAAFTQTALNEISFLTRYSGFGARAMGLGGAYVSIGGDYSSVYWNPAGLGMVQRKELYTSFIQLNTNNKASFYGVDIEESRNATKLDGLGYVFPMETFRGSLVFALGYQQIHHFDDDISLKGRNPKMAYSFYLFENLNVGDQLYVRETLKESGGIGQYIFSGSVEAQENLFLGVTLNLYRGTNEYNLYFIESDDRELYEETDNTGFAEYRQSTVIKSELNAYDLKIGGLYNVNDMIFIGGTVTLPKTYEIKETYSLKDYLNFDDGYSEPYDEYGVYRYKVKYPFIFSLGGSLNIQNILVSGDIEYTDMSQIEYKNDPPIEDLDREEANIKINDEVESVLAKRLGAEIMIPNTSFKLRGGYFEIPNPYKLTPSDRKTKGMTGGIGIVLNESSILDLSFVKTWWNESVYDDLIGSNIDESHKKNHFYATLSVRF